MEITADAFRAFGWNDLRATYILYRMKEDSPMSRVAWTQVRLQLERAMRAMDIRGNLHYFAGCQWFFEELDKRSKDKAAPAWEPMRAEEWVELEHFTPVKRHGVPNPFCLHCYNSEGMKKVDVQFYNDTLLLPDTMFCSWKCAKAALRHRLILDNALNMFFNAVPPRPDNPFLLKDNIELRIANLPPMSYETNWQAFQSIKAVEETKKASEKKQPPPLKFLKG